MQGAPSVVHSMSAHGGEVGATDLMRASHGEVLLLDLTASVELQAQRVSGDAGGDRA
jgi:hypothetical protein